MLIRSVEFIKSSSKWQECPEANLPEYAFIGRSNVGKSSLINAMMDRKDLAKTSQTPGKTQLINHFMVNETWYLTDLPGYGYAKVSKSLRKDFEKLITNYILNRKNLVNLFVLIDIRHSPQKIDIEFMQWCGESGIPFSIVFTKSDKLKPKAIENHVVAYQKELLEFWEELPQSFITSAEKKEGGDQILDFIGETNTILEKNKVKF
ncbi:ribosome biogenesis GTP-binding protein YihA/YsxC [Elizabethkingia meningoseptica]|uniref:ribosome biogenesis GTP-binding protein YihA/YsxC n=1 Tax=Elizabethkingia meningoseptica TaxID=238 RepID=UPI000937C5D7|nr:ribosome biogenesis GTP-binding protein YihA/YsxC [Elizabethkingia meningoseptica]MCL1675788.1 ribosome biogenesis GTP-binding protein YihA/YsxC [Elizabethkingia meningoseptica]MCL1686503.1 ribosome biogenesis GTP-binding protein YihA/YsxC [Elizabethkingia meningoseptica]MDE5439806.1 ribosome biogenesis GTP-binding protein YihA/YsxC [Elizabethkingia meningoseptica]MDE5490434.1 ribosome biogenesis GTP-binding protein YihA/YsxC [Elizabethkingia meningoseptica]MDE5510588.1 ribosome biogenesis 